MQGRSCKHSPAYPGQGPYEYEKLHQLQSSLIFALSLMNIVFSTSSKQEKKYVFQEFSLIVMRLYFVPFVLLGVLCVPAVHLFFFQTRSEFEVFWNTKVTKDHKGPLDQFYNSEGLEFSSFRNLWLKMGRS